MGPLMETNSSVMFWVLSQRPKNIMHPFLHDSGSQTAQKNFIVLSLSKSN